MAHLNRRAKALTAVLATAALFITACGSSNDTSDAAGGAVGATGGDGAGTIISGVAYATTNYHPSSTSSALAMGTNWHVVEGLYEQDLSDYSVYKALAAEDEPTEISDTEYEISIREGAKFSDGSDVTSADVVSSFDRAMAEGNIYAAMVDFIDTVEAKDDTTVTLKLQYPFELLKERLSVVKIVPESASDDELTSMPIGSGPYKYESITDAQVVAVPNENYNGEKEATNGKLVW
ncbi:MAG: ABC transporter substrate-binding protein, partial [Corynebacterium casei]